jgi:hypothetical protein
MAFIAVYALACSIEFIIFNEEILLAICFFSFVFFCYNTFSESLFSSLEARASKFEADFLVSFASKKEASVVNFKKLFFTRGYQAKFQILLTSILTFLTFSQLSLLLGKVASVQTSSLAKLTELMLINNRCYTCFQNKRYKPTHPIIFFNFYFIKIM